MLGKGWTIVKSWDLGLCIGSDRKQTWQILAAPHSRTRSKRIVGEANTASHWHLVGILLASHILIPSSRATCCTQDFGAVVLALKREVCAYRNVGNGDCSYLQAVQSVLALMMTCS